MKIRSLTLLLVLLGLTAGLAPRPVSAQEEVSFNFFFDALKPYGDWIQVGDYGLCWHPAGVSPDWAPYTDGYWAYTEGGWTWVSYEDFGGVVYHYGRWVDTDEEGWCWVPDYQWAPAWVSWRSSNDYVGWAPLPPECSWQPDVGVSVWADATYDIGPGCFHFCRFADFGAPVLTAVLLPRAENVAIINSTVNITNITYNRGSGIVFVGGPRFDVVARRVGRPIPTLRLVQQTNVANFFVNGKRPQIQTLQKGNALFLPAPVVKPTNNPLALLPNFKPSKVIAATHVNKGWNLIQNPQEREQLRKTLLTQTKGKTPQSAPARAFDPAEIKVIPKRGNAEGGLAEGIEKEHAIKPNAPIEPVNPSKGLSEGPGKIEREKPLKLDKPPVVGEPIEGNPKIQREKPLKPVVTGGQEPFEPREPKKISAGDRPPEPPVIKRQPPEVIEDRRPPVQPKIEPKAQEIEKEQKLQKEERIQKEEKIEQQRQPKTVQPQQPPGKGENPNGSENKKGKHPLTPEEAAALQGR